MVLWTVVAVFAGLAYLLVRKRRMRKTRTAQG
jgi:hypothetical protein